MVRVKELVNGKVEYLKYLDDNSKKRHESLGVLLINKHLNSNKKLYSDKRINSDILGNYHITINNSIFYLKPITFDFNTAKGGIVERQRLKYRVTSGPTFIENNNVIILGVYPTGEKDIYIVFENTKMKTYDSKNETSCWIDFDLLEQTYKCGKKKVETSKQTRDFDFRLAFTEEYLKSFIDLCNSGVYDGGSLEGFNLEDLYSSEVKFNEFEVIKDGRCIVEENMRDRIFGKINKEKKVRKNINYYRDKMYAKGICLELDNDETFINKNGKKYNEIHHLVPHKYKDAVSFDIDSEANLILLSANKHMELHHGKRNKKLLEECIKCKGEDFTKLVDFNGGIKELVNDIYEIYY